MKNKSKIIIVLFLSFSVLSFVYKIAPKDRFLILLEEKLELFNREKQREFVYLMLDKPFYKPGESIWFSAWVTEGNYLKSTHLSQKLYVELINPKGNVVKLLQLPIFRGKSNGDFELAANDAGGIYKIRAYTRYSKNFGKQHIFEKEITVQKIVVPRLLMKLDFQKKAYGPGDIVNADFSARDLENNPIALHNCKYSIYLNGALLSSEEFKTSAEGKAMIDFSLPKDLNSNDGLLNIQLNYKGEKESIARSIPIVLNHISLNFYPEGGKIIANTINNIAFKALDEFGKPADFEAVLLNENNQTIKTFNSFYQGYGSFRFMPDGQHTYKVKITKPLGVNTEFLLPKAYERGSSLQLVENKENKLKLQWNSEKKDSVYLVVSIRDVIYYSAKLPGTKGKDIKLFDTKDWPFGVAKISMFNEKRIVVSERLVYVGPRNPMKINIETDKKSYKPGDSVNIKLIAKTFDNKPIKAKLAISIVDNKLYSFADDRQDNILSYLLMSNELNETIEEPLYYFNADKEKAWQALDYVLMCSSLKRLSWLEIINNKPRLRFFAERQGMISGRIINKRSRKGVEATVWMGENKGGAAESQVRTAHVKTTKNGYFNFVNVNPSATIYLYAKSKHEKSENLQIITERELQNSEMEFGEYVKDVPEQFIVEKKEPVINNRKGKGLNSKLNSGNKGKRGNIRNREKAEMGIGGLFKDDEDKAIEELVIIALGISKNNKASGHVVYNMDDEILHGHDILKALDGGVSGIDVVNNTTGAIDKVKIRIRGANTVNSNSNPLYVIDGVPVVLGQNQDIDPFSFLNPDDIRSITVYKNAEAQSIYGCRAADGAIIIKTKRTRKYKFRSGKKEAKSPYVSAIIYPKTNTFSPRRRFDAYVQNMKGGNNSSDFRSTLYWDPLIETDENGVANVTFVNSDEVSSFKIIAEGISANGSPGRGESEYHTILPVYVTAKVPAFVCFADTVKIPLMVANNTNSDVSGQLNILAGSALRPVNEIPSVIKVKAGEKQVVQLLYFVENKAGKRHLNVSFNNNEFTDEIKHEFEVVPSGFPVLKSFSAQELDKEYEIEVTDVLNGSLQVQLTAYPNVITDIFSGMEGLLREPHGCFEQTSAISYPNVLVMDYLIATKNKDKKILLKAKGLLEKGYSRLTSFETPTKGYEWYGRSPGHEALTAYGLMQFNDMKTVGNYVDYRMVDRTANWLLKARDGKGTFMKNSNATGAYGRADDNITNAYIVYALTDAAYKNLNLEFETSYTDAIESEDPYMYALMANAAISINDKAKANALLALLYKEQKADGSWHGKKHSITHSTGNSLIVETTSLAVMAIMKSEKPDQGVLNKAIQFLVKSRSGYGTFGSTQATILALKAITRYVKFSKKVGEAGTIEIYVDGKKVAQRYYKKGETQAIVMDGLEHVIGEGRHKIRVRFVGCEEALPYSLAVNWRTKTPRSSKKCKLNLDCELQSNHISVSDVVRMSVKLSNTTNRGLPMSMIKIGIPGGLAPQPWQLKELRDKKIIDFYEIFDNYLVFYFRQMAPEEIKQIKLDLKADMAGVYEGAASCAYLYYTDEDKDWLKGLKIKIKE